MNVLVFKLEITYLDHNYSHNVENFMRFFFLIKVDFSFFVLSSLKDSTIIHFK